ncbi:MAG TPA: DUF4397 domain-containing protein [Casimicrobiaceae bacterium]|nr:DUF4397 domain-containing protein [Casimicrobiaceae bacterium]
MILARLAHALAAKLRVLALAFAAVMLASCGSGSSFFGTLPASVRVFNALLDAGSIDLIVYVEPVVTDLPFEGVTTYQSVDAGQRQVTVQLAGGTSTIYQQTALILDGAKYTYIVSGTTAAPSVQILVDQIVQDQPPAAGMFKLRISNAAITSDAFDVYVSPPGELLDNMSPTFSGLTYGSSTAYTQIPGGMYQVRFTLPGSKQVIYDGGTLTFSQNVTYEIAGYSRGSGTLVNGALFVVDSTGTSSIVDSLLAQLKFVHGAPNTGTVNVFTDGLVSFSNVPYQSASIYDSVLTGAHTVTIEATRVPGAAIATVQPPFAAATDTSVVLFGHPGAQSAFAVSDLNLPPTVGRARIRFVNAGSDLVPVDILVNFANVFSGVGATTASTYLEELEDTYTITFVAAGSTNQLLAAPVSLTAGRTYSMYLVGTAGQYGAVLTRDD